MHATPAIIVCAYEIMGVPLILQRDFCHRNSICANMVCDADRPISKYKWKDSNATHEANTEPNYKMVMMLDC